MPILIDRHGVFHARTRFIHILPTIWCNSRRPNVCRHKFAITKKRYQMNNNKIFNRNFAITALFLVAFTTGCSDRMVGVDGYCPVVEATYPANSATNVESGAVLTVTFTDKMNPDTIIPSSFSFTENPSQTAKRSSNGSEIQQASKVSGTMTYDVELLQKNGQ